MSKKFICEVCSLAFNQSSSLQTHINGLHLNQKNAYCEICNKGVFCNGDLKTQMLTHFKEGWRYTCEFCSKKFRMLTHLKDHRNMHMTVVRFQCDYCSKSYNVHSNKIRHMRKSCKSIRNRKQKIKLKKSCNSVANIQIQKKKSTIIPVEKSELFYY